VANVFEECIISIATDHGNAWKLWNGTPETLVATGTRKKPTKQYVIKGKAKFKCNACNKKWTSSEAKLKVYYRKKTIECVDFIVELFGQGCQACCDPDEQNYTVADWYEDEIERISKRVFNRVTKGNQTGRKQRWSRRRKVGHDTFRCEACHKNVCCA